MADLIIPPQWARLAAEAWRGTVMVIGASDTGKSTLTRHLFEELCRRGNRVAYLDLDPGQGLLGPPTTLAACMAPAGNPSGFPPSSAPLLYFVGSNTPRGHMLPAVIGAYRLQQKALAWGAHVVLVDTTGLVDPAQGGKALKQWKIELLAPQAVIALQRSQELELILWPLRREGRCRAIELCVSPHAIGRSREERIARRRERFAGYFEGAQLQSVKLGQLPIYDLERLANSSLVAFQDGEGFALALGAVEHIKRIEGSLAIRTPLSTLSGVASLRVGSTRWDVVNRCER